jgi:hypothetical protein
VKYKVYYPLESKPKVVDTFKLPLNRWKGDAEYSFPEKTGLWLLNSKREEEGTLTIRFKRKRTLADAAF